MKSLNEIIALNAKRIQPDPRNKPAFDPKEVNHKSRGK